MTLTLVSKHPVETAEVKVGASEEFWRIRIENLGRLEHSRFVEGNTPNECHLEL